MLNTCLLKGRFNLVWLWIGCFVECQAILKNGSISSHFLGQLSSLYGPVATSSGNLLGCKFCDFI
jgi:hypothetical protein